MITSLLLDIEGTTSSVSFVFDVMFPYVRREITNYLHAQAATPACRHALDQLAQDAGHTSWDTWCQSAGASNAAAQRELVVQEVTRLMDADVKATGLKQLQGLIWEAGFTSGELLAHVFDDVVPTLQRWQAAGREVRIYSSGSIQAQILFFGHTEQGNLLPLVSGHYDTTSGSKREAESYRRIAAHWGRSPEEIVFVSDIVAELTAAQAAGLHTVLCQRPGNAPQAATPQQRVVQSLLEIEL